MADFRQLALEFVLADDEKTLTRLSQTAATELQNAPANTNPVARWVEAVQPWMPGHNGEDAMDTTDDTPDWTARARALDFLARTLGYISKDTLKPSQVKLLVAFFGAMFDVDHKAGIQASATALSTIADMRSFQPQSANDIISKVCSLKDDFPRQVAKTRLTVHQLLRQLVSNPDVAADLQRKHGDAAGFIRDLVLLCKSERDPDCLMVWFDVLRIFLSEYSLSDEILEEVYGCFKSYFPITLPRSSQSGVTPDELKLQLRQCFSSNQKLAKHVFPFLIGKLDQGDAITVNVKLDILRTTNACLEKYSDPEQSIKPYINTIWGSLKYEVRNGEIEDTIWATLEVLKTLTSRLSGDNLRDFTLTVTRECVNDFSNATFAASSGRLLVGILSASPSAFVLMVSPALTHIKDNLRHRKSPAHSQDLLKILHIILETRILLTGANMTTQEKSDFSAVDNVFKSLYDDVYKGPVGLGSKENLSEEDTKIATQAVQGAGALICQQVAHPAVESGPPNDLTSQLLLPGKTCSDICEALFAIITETTGRTARSKELDDLVNETTKALQRAVQAYGSCYQPLVDKALKIVSSTWTTNGADGVEVIQSLCLFLAFIGCAELPNTLGDGISHYLYLIRALTAELFAAIDAGSHPSVWCALVAGLQSAARYFNDANLAKSPNKEHALPAESWQDSIVKKYPALDSLGGQSEVTGQSAETLSKVSSAGEARNDFLLISLFTARQLYRKIITSNKSTGQPLSLRDGIARSDDGSLQQYLYLISTFAGFVVHELSEPHQLALGAEAYAFNLFHEDVISIPSQPAGDQQPPDSGSWNWLLSGEVNVLSLGILETLRPTAVQRLFDAGVGQAILLASIKALSNIEDETVRSISQAITTILANKFKIESLPSLLSTIEEQASATLNTKPSDSSTADQRQNVAQVTAFYPIANGLVRRGSGRQAPATLGLLRRAPRDPAAGYRFARSLEMLVAPQSFLTKENYAVVKPLWLQKAYVELVKPLLSVATGSDPEIQDLLIKMNHGIGALSMAKHMDIAIFEDDSEAMLRVSIMTAQSLGTGLDTQASLEVLKTTLFKTPGKAQGHLRSLVDICVQCFSTKASSTTRQRPDWLPADYASSADDPSSQAACGRLGLEILGGMPAAFEASQLLPFAPMVGKVLTVACGHHVRDLRKLARLARAAWAGLK
ncbi:hypothetical protein S40293_06085 [Stachybotrys chartarum IBT 40293]|nr:hypothetical protein S40293_06085 [Stachybotrys chartarum IBT 40293]